MHSGSACLGRIAGYRCSQNRTVVLSFHFILFYFIYICLYYFFDYQRTTFRTLFSSSTMWVPLDPILQADPRLSCPIGFTHRGILSKISPGPSVEFDLRDTLTLGCHRPLRHPKSTPVSAAPLCPLSRPRLHSLLFLCVSVLMLCSIPISACPFCVTSCGLGCHA